MVIKAHIERTVQVHPDRAWELLGDFAHVQHIHPLVGKVDQVTPDKDRGVGAIRTCHLYDGNTATEQIETWDESNRSYTIRLMEASLPVKSIVVTLHAVPGQDSQHQTTLIADMKLQAKFGLLGKLMERLVLKPQLGAAIGNLFAGLEKYDQTGVDIPKGLKAKTKPDVFY